MREYDYYVLQAKRELADRLANSWDAYREKLSDLYEDIISPDEQHYPFKLSRLEKFDYDTRKLADNVKDLMNWATSKSKRWEKEQKKIEAQLATPEAKEFEKDYLEDYDSTYFPDFSDFEEELLDEDYLIAKEEQEAEEYEDYDDPAADPIDCGFCAGESIRPEPRDFSGTGIGG